MLLVAAPATAAPMSSGERSVLAEMNRVRAQHGLAPLRFDRTLQRAARSHTRSMVARNVFAHPTLSEAVKEAVHGIAGHMINF